MTSAPPGILQPDIYKRRIEQFLSSDPNRIPFNLAGKLIKDRRAVEAIRFAQLSDDPSNSEEWPNPLPAMLEYGPWQPGLMLRADRSAWFRISFQFPAEWQHDNVYLLWKANAAGTVYDATGEHVINGLSEMSGWRFPIGKDQQSVLIVKQSIDDCDFGDRNCPCHI